MNPFDKIKASRETEEFKANFNKVKDYKFVLVDTEEGSLIYCDNANKNTYFVNVNMRGFPTGGKNKILCVVSSEDRVEGDMCVNLSTMEVFYFNTNSNKVSEMQQGLKLVSSSSADYTPNSLISEKMQKEVVDNIVDSVLPEIKNFKNNFIKSANCATHSDGQDVCKCYNEIDFDVIPQGKMIHELKTIQPYFNEVFMGHKTFEIRRNDRCFQKGDTLILKEWDNEKQKYTGKSLARTVAFILEDAPQFGLMDGFVIMSIQ